MTSKPVQSEKNFIVLCWACRKHRVRNTKVVLCDGLLGSMSSLKDKTIPGKGYLMSREERASWHEVKRIR